MRTFKRASAPGPSGLRSDHLREALQTAHADEVAAHLALLSHTLARGEAPASVAPHLVRRLVGKLLCQAVKEARDCFWPLQVGIGTPAAARYPPVGSTL